MGRRPRDFLPHRYALAYAYLLNLGKRKKFEFMPGSVRRIYDQNFMEVWVYLLGRTFRLRTLYPPCNTGAFRYGDPVLVYARDCDYSRMVVIGTYKGAPRRCGSLQVVAWGEPYKQTVHAEGPFLVAPEELIPFNGPDGYPVTIDYIEVENPTQNAANRTSTEIRLLRFDVQGRTMTEVYSTVEAQLGHWRMYGKSGAAVDRFRDGPKGILIEVQGMGSHGPRDGVFPAATTDATSLRNGTVPALNQTPKKALSALDGPKVYWEDEKRALWGTYYALDDAPARPTLMRTDLRQEGALPEARLALEVPDLTITKITTTVLPGGPGEFEDSAAIYQMRKFTANRPGGAFSLGTGDYFVMEVEVLTVQNPTHIAPPAGGMEAVFQGYAYEFVTHTRDLVVVHGPTGTVARLSTTGECDGSTMPEPATMDGERYGFFNSATAYPNLAGVVFAANLLPGCLLGVEVDAALTAAPFTSSQVPQVRDGTSWFRHAHLSGVRECVGEVSLPVFPNLTVAGGTAFSSGAVARPVASDTRLYVTRVTSRQQSEPVPQNQFTSGPTTFETPATTARWVNEHEDLVSYPISPGTIGAPRIVLRGYQPDVTVNHGTLGTSDGGAVIIVGSPKGHVYAMDVTPTGSVLTFMAYGIFSLGTSSRKKFFAGVYTVDASGVEPTNLRFVESCGLRYTASGLGLFPGLDSADELATGEELEDGEPETGYEMVQPAVWGQAAFSDGRAWFDTIRGDIVYLNTSHKITRVDEETLLDRMQDADDPVVANDGPDARWVDGTFILVNGNSGDGTFGGEPRITAAEAILDIPHVNVPEFGVTGHAVVATVRVLNAGDAPAYVTAVTLRWRHRETGQLAPLTDFVPVAPTLPTRPLLPDGVPFVDITMRFNVRLDSPTGLYVPEPSVTGQTTATPPEVITGQGTLAAGAVLLKANTGPEFDTIEVETTSIVKPAGITPDTVGSTAAQETEVVVPYHMVTSGSAAVSDVYDNLVVVDFDLVIKLGGVDKTSDFDVLRGQSFTRRFGTVLGVAQEIRRAHSNTLMRDDRVNLGDVFRELFAPFTVAAKTSAAAGTYTISAVLQYRHQSDPDNTVHTATTKAGQAATLEVLSPARLSFDSPSINLTVAEAVPGTIRRKNTGTVDFSLINSGQGAASVPTVELVFTKAGEDRSSRFTATTSTGAATVAGGGTEAYSKGFRVSVTAEDGEFEVQVRVTYVDVVSGSVYTLTSALVGTVVVFSRAQIRVDDLSRGVAPGSMKPGDVSQLDVTLDNLHDVLPTTPGTLTVTRHRLRTGSTDLSAFVAGDTGNFSPALPVPVNGDESGLVIEQPFSITADYPLAFSGATVEVSLDITYTDADTLASASVFNSPVVVPFQVFAADVKLTATERIAPIVAENELGEPVNLRVTVTNSDDGGGAAPTATVASVTWRMERRRVVAGVTVAEDVTEHWDVAAPSLPTLADGATATLDYAVTPKLTYPADKRSGTVLFFVSATYQVAPDPARPVTVAAQPQDDPPTAQLTAS